MITDNIRKGIEYMLIASFCFALTGACARILKDDISNVEMVLYRNLVGVVFISYSIYKRPLVQIGGKLPLLIFRGLIGTLALYSFFYGITKIGLAVAITYQQSYPVFLAVIGALFLGDRLMRREWIGVIIGFLGIGLIFFPQLSESHLEIKSHVIGLSNAVMTGLAYLSIRGLSTYYDDRSIVLSFMLSGIMLPVLSLIIGNVYENQHLDFILAKFEWPEMKSWTIILLLGIFALIGQIYLTKAFSFQKTGVIAAAGYSNIVFSVIFGVFLGDAFPGVFGMTGIVLVIVCGLFISWKKGKN